MQGNVRERVKSETGRDCFAVCNFAPRQITAVSVITRPTNLPLDNVHASILWNVIWSLLHIYPSQIAHGSLIAIVWYIDTNVAPQAISGRIG